MKAPSNLQNHLRRISDYFDEHGQPWIVAYQSQHSKWHEFFPLRNREDYALALIAREPRGTTIDLGCGSGNALVRMKRMGFERVIGVDISKQMLRQASQRIDEEKLSTAIDLFRSDVQNLSMIRSESIDSCIALGVIEYLKNDGPILSEMNRILRSNGAAVLQARNYYCLNSRTAKLLRALASMLLPKFKSRIWYREHRPNQLKASLSRAGFEVEQECFSHFYPLYPLNLVPIIRRIIKPIDDYASKLCERWTSRSFARYFASMYIVRIRKVRDITR